MKNDYYTYAYLREDGTPYYIGKGKGRRAYDKKRRIKPPPAERILLLKKNLTEEEAFRHEVYMIAVLGRKDTGTGILRNLTNGGDGCSGLLFSEESRAKISAYHRGRKLSEEHKAKISIAHKGKPKPPLSEETKAKMSAAKKGKKFSEEHRANLRLSAAKRKKVR